jgi:hypothetical protein
MLKEDDEQWLRANYPGLVRKDQIVIGIVEFTAGYRSETNQFVILRGSPWDGDGAEVLTAKYDVRIEERVDKSTSRLPALFVDGVEPVPERHFNQKDHSACLCSPLEEREFLEPELHFTLFVERLIIPFLYGQTFYSSHRRWPWGEYAHGATGILEAYSTVHDPTRAEECLHLLKKEGSWLRIQSALGQKPYVKGHTLCFCEKGDQIRRCHPRALTGLLQLQRHLAGNGFSTS